MDDLIRRQDAIDAIQCDWCKDPIKNIPSAQKKGYWIEKKNRWGDTYFDCSCCEMSFALVDRAPSDNLYNFCPNCGADMRGD